MKAFVNNLQAAADTMADESHQTEFEDLVYV